MVGIVHAKGHSCGSVSNVDHGDAMTILLPHCMELNLGLCEEDYSRILLAFSGPEFYSQTPKDQIGVKEEGFENIVKTSMNDGAAIVNPVEVTFDRVMKILNKAY